MIGCLFREVMLMVIGEIGWVEVFLEDVEII